MALKTSLYELLSPFASRKFVLVALCSTYGTFFVTDVTGAEKLAFLASLALGYGVVNVAQKKLLE